MLESCRTSVGEQCTYGIEVHGERGALAWDFRRMGELQLCVDQDFQNASYVTEFVGTGAGEFGSFQPAGGISMSYDDLKVIEAHRLVSSIAAGAPARRNDPRRRDRRRAGRRHARVRPQRHLAPPAV